MRIGRGWRGAGVASLLLSLFGSALAGALTAAAASRPTVAWSPGSVEMTVAAGASTSASVSFTASKALSNVTLAAVPKVKALVTTTPSGVASVAAGAPVAVSLAVAVPAATPPGDYSGAIQVLVAGKKQAKPLPLTIHVTGSSCAPGTQGCSWQDGDFRIYTQSSWEGTGESTLESNYNAVFQSTFGTLTIGDPSGFTASWTTVGHVEAYLPQGGAPGTLDANTVDTTSTSSGGFGGDAVALTLNVAFSDAGATPSYGTLRFGDVHVCTTGTSADGKTVGELLAYTNSLLSFGPPSEINSIGPVLAVLNASFDNGTVSSWARTHLVSGSCP